MTTTPASITLHAETLYTRTRPVPGGHLVWTGPYDGATPVLHLRGYRYPARDLFFQEHHGRQPVGGVTTSCDDTRCVAPHHLLDLGLRNAAAVDPVLAYLMLGLGVPSSRKSADPRQRLLDEEIPTGTVRDWDPAKGEITPEQADRNRRRLEEAITPARRRAA